MPQKYRVLYCAKISDEKHAEMLKIGDTEFLPTKVINTYQPNEDELVIAAKARIRSWSGTAASGAELVYCAPLVRYNPTTNNYESFRDSNIHTVLQHAGFPRTDFDSDLDSGREWYKVDLPTVKAAINAAMEYRDYLDTSELPEQEIYELRDEQKKAVEDTIKRFTNKDNMLWHAKMRFGKTITALNLIKQIPEFKRTIIITHRPVVEDSWGSDFYHVFSREDRIAFLTKIQNADMVLSESETDEAIDIENDARLTQLVNEDRRFVYFASIQDLRGSKRVGGPFEKNNVVFDVDWDFVIVDEAHEGTKTELGQSVIDLLVKDNTKKLDLSGTAYNLFDKYTEKGSVFTWDYVMEQEAKRDWPRKHPGEKNPYEDMPVMHINTFDLEKAITQNDLDLNNVSFSFREFFRTWTGDLSKDGMPIPEGSELGDFVHEEAVRRFLDLLSLNDSDSRFPYVTKDQCNQNRHSLWMIPGVKEAAALSKMLKSHPFFGKEELFGIANVAGEGDHDEEQNYHNALEHVRKTIERHPNSITLSCGRLTTGVTVKEWTSVFMLSGSETTDAKNYMQTIFRVQSAGKIDGVQKTDAFVYDFAPDRTLIVLAEAILGSKHGRGGTVVDSDESHAAFESFLNFCPVVAIDGSTFKPFGVESLISQINRVQIDRALRTGFMDNGIYDMSKFSMLTDEDLEKMDAIFKKLKETKAKGPLSRAGMGRNGTNQGSSQTGSRSGNSNQSNSGSRDEEREEKDLEKKVLERLRTISIRIPLLFFGGDFEIEEGRLGEMITSIDPVSWNVFMPEGLSTDDFLELVKYYNQETVIGAAKIIRSKAIDADKLSPTERVIAITDIFSHFHNPSKETVLTPWRVVNMHMADTLGGWCFFNEKYEENDDEYYNRLHEPRFVNHGEVTANTLSNKNASILEINSKSGLYPLYVVYSLYKSKLENNDESKLLPSELIKIWDEAVKQVYVLCQSSMAASITKHTLIGFRNVDTNVKYDENLLDGLKQSIQESATEILKGSYWGKEVIQMKFDAIVGNPPYMEMDEGAQASAKPIYQHFISASFAMNPSYTSFIIPSRWYAGGKGLDDFRDMMLDNNHIKELHDVLTPDYVFPNTNIRGGVCYFLWDKSYDNRPDRLHVVTHDAEEIISDTYRPLKIEGADIFVRYQTAIAIIKKVQELHEEPISKYVSPRRPFGLDGNIVGTDMFHTNKSEVRDPLKCYGKSGAEGYVDKSLIASHQEWAQKWKVFMPYANNIGTELNDDNQNTFLGEPGTVCTETFIFVGVDLDLNSQTAENLSKYLRTKFARFLHSIAKASQHGTAKTYCFVPTVDLSKEWTDAELYQRYGLSDDEISFIERMIKPMEVLDNTLSCEEEIEG